MSRVDIINFKAFGDFVIACNTLRNVEQGLKDETPKIVAGSHVFKLAFALGIVEKVILLGSDSMTVPPAFDMRKHGFFSGIKSLFALKGLVDNCTDVGDSILFDRLGFREKLIGGSRRLQQLPKKVDNIYLAYGKFFNHRGASYDRCVIRNFNRVVIIPGARMAYRAMPPAVIINYVRTLFSLDFRVDVVIFDDEFIDLPKNISCKKIKKSFSFLIEEIKSADLVISADSLPAHLSEYFKIPIYVSTPAPKKYWLPESSFVTNGWSVFSDSRSFKDWIFRHGTI